MEAFLAKHPEFKESKCLMEIFKEIPGDAITSMKNEEMFIFEKICCLMIKTENRMGRMVAMGQKVVETMGTTVTFSEQMNTHPKKIIAAIQGITKTSQEMIKTISESVESDKEAMLEYTHMITECFPKQK